MTAFNITMENSVPPKKSYNIIFAGTPRFSAITLSALLASPHKILAVYTQPDRPAGRGRKLTPSPVKELALQHHLSIHQPVTLRDEHEQKVLADLNADVMIVVAYGLLLPVPVLQAPRFGCINVHASLLPRWRGAAPIQRAIFAGDKTTGITIMQMDKGLDTGDMLHKVECPIHVNDTSAILHDRLAVLGAEALLTTLNGFDCIKPEKQNSDLATYAQKITKEEAEIDWNMPAIELMRKVHAFNPWPVAFTHLNDHLVRVWGASVIEKNHTAKPGMILQASADGIDVATGNGILRLLTLQLPGGKPLAVKDILNARQNDFTSGICFRNPA